MEHEVTRPGMWQNLGVLSNVRVEFQTLTLLELREVCVESLYYELPELLEPTNTYWNSAGRLRKLMNPNLNPFDAARNVKILAGGFAALTALGVGNAATNDDSLIGKLMNLSKQF